jgi:methylisocitrate lyase
VPGAPNALLARLIERCGYDAMYLSGAAFSAGVLGLPDVGLFTLSELAQQTTYLTRACALPLIVDADTGFGEALNVERTVRQMEGAGVAAIHLEDQQLPKRCGHLSGKSLVDAEVGYQFDLVKVALGVRNLFDTYPDQPSSERPVDPADPEGDKVRDYNNNFGTFPWAAASPFGYNGRFAYARTEIQLTW